MMCTTEPQSTFRFLGTDEADRIIITHEDVKRGVEDLLLDELHRSRTVLVPTVPPSAPYNVRTERIPLKRNGKDAHVDSLLLIGSAHLLASVSYNTEDELSDRFAGIILSIRKNDGTWTLQKVLHYGHINAWDIAGLGRSAYPGHQRNLAELIALALA